MKLRLKDNLHKLTMTALMLSSIGGIGLTVLSSPTVHADEIEVKPDFKVREIEEVKDVNYETKGDDSLWGVARENKVSIQQLKIWNKELDKVSSDKMPEKLKLKVNEEKHKKEQAYKVIKAEDAQFHTVASGDTISHITNEYNISYDKIHELNDDLRKDNIIFPNQKLKVKSEVKEHEKILTDEEKKHEIKIAEEKTKELKAQAEAEKVQQEQQVEQAQAPAQQTQSSPRATPRISGNASESAQKLIAEAYKHIGKGYTQGPGRQGPNMFDCSGLTQYVFKQALGIDIGSWTVPQESSGTQISVGEAQPGDLYFWGGNGGTTHVALAIGNGEYIHAPTYGETVKVGNVNWFTPSFAVRVL